ncbi:UNVERIFIED_CONTAM: hypothetical protein HHA_449070 [Hammondia hammondi]|eukprot:XP_008881653.1 hypothetical protein HHA_449070 [Hammondia hammondi]
MVKGPTARMSNAVETNQTLLGIIRSLEADIRGVRDELRQILTVLKDFLSLADEKKHKESHRPRYLPPQRRTLVMAEVPELNSGAPATTQVPDRVSPASGRSSVQLDRLRHRALVKSSSQHENTKASHRLGAPSASVKRANTWMAPRCISYLDCSNKGHDMPDTHDSNVTADSEKNDKKEVQRLNEGKTRCAAGGGGNGERKQKSQKRASDELRCSGGSSVKLEEASFKKQCRFTTHPATKLHVSIPVNEEDPEQNDICNLCLMQKKDSLHPGPPVLFTLECGHEYHLACLSECVSRRECRKDCPICTKPVEKDDIRKILTKKKFLKRSMQMQQKQLARAVAEAIV